MTLSLSHIQALEDIASESTEITDSHLLYIYSCKLRSKRLFKADVGDLVIGLIDEGWGHTRWDVGFVMSNDLDLSMYEDRPGAEILTIHGEVQIVEADIMCRVIVGEYPWSKISC